MTTWSKILGTKEEDEFLTWDDLKWQNKIGCYCAASGHIAITSMCILLSPLNIYLLFNPIAILSLVSLCTLVFTVVFILTFIGFYKSTREAYYFPNSPNSINSTLLLDLLSRGSNKKRYTFKIIGFNHKNHNFVCTFHITFAKMLTRKEFTINADENTIDTLMELKRNKRDKEALEFLEDYLIMECL